MSAESRTSPDGETFDVAALVARAEIMHVLTRHVRAIDRKDWDLWRLGFHDDATQTHGDFDGDVAGLLAWIIQKHASVPNVLHHLGGVHIELRGQVALVESSFLAFETLDPPLVPKRTHQVTGARWVDRFESRSGGPWKIARRIVVHHFTRQMTEHDSDQRFARESLTAQSRGPDDPLFRLRREMFG
jgi:hypothetical protein